jgi:hypothetical protein
VTDSQGTQATDSIFIYPNKINLTVQSDPPGIALSLDQTTQPTPIVLDTLVNFEHVLSAPQQAIVAGKTYQFQSWSDGGAIVHTVQAPNSDQTYIATYQELTSEITQTFQVNGGGDDVNEVNATLDASAETVWLGNESSATTSFTGLRFTNVSIPQGAAILSAHLEVYSTQTQWVVVSYAIGAENVGNSNAFSAVSRPSQRLLTAQQVDHSSNVQWTANTWYTIDELASIVQAVVDRPDWQAGNSLSIILKGTGGAWARKNVQSSDSTGGNAPRLVITLGAEGAAAAVNEEDLPEDSHADTHSHEHTDTTNSPLPGKERIVMPMIRN